MGRFVVCHAGNIGYVYDLETLLDAARMLEDDGDVVFLIVGDGVAKATLEGKAQRLDLSNVRFLPFQPQEELPYLRAATDVHLALYRRGASAYSMPSKLYEIMASGRPVIASGDDQSDIKALVERVAFGIFLEPSDPDALANAVLELKRDPHLRNTMGKRGRAEAENHYSLEAVADQYMNLFNELVGTAR